MGREYLTRKALTLLAFPPIHAKADVGGKGVNDAPVVSQIESRVPRSRGIIG